MGRKVPKNITVDLSLLEDIERLSVEKGISFSAYAHRAFAHMLVHELSGETIDDYGIANEPAPSESPAPQSAPQPAKELWAKNQYGGFRAAKNYDKEVYIKRDDGTFEPTTR